MIKLPKIDVNYFEQLKSLLNSYTEKTQFVINCAKDVQHLHNIQEVNNCIEQGIINNNDIKELIYSKRSKLTAINYISSLVICSKPEYSAVHAASAIACSIFHSWNSSILYKNIIRFYIYEIGMIFFPISTKSSPDFNLNNQEEFLIALDFIKEHRHNDLIVQENSLYYYLKFYEFIKANSINELVNVIFDNEFYRKQVIRVIKRMLND